MNKLFDTHCHLEHKLYNKSAEEVIRDSEASGVGLLMNIGTDLKENQRAIELAEKHVNVFCSIGIYPHDEIDKSVESLEKELREQILSASWQKEKIVGVGECGLDITDWQAGRSLDEQIELFEMQIKLAIEFKKTLVIHNRNGDKEVLKLANKYGGQGLRGVCHSFTQNWDYAKEMLDPGFYLSFSGIITYKSGEEICEIIKKMPQDRILAETDSPYLLPEPLRSEFKGYPNEPKNVALVVQKIAELRSISYDEAAKITYENGKTAFGIN